MKKVSERIIVTPHSKTMTSVYCEIDILNICRSQFGTIRAALHFAANNANLKNFKPTKNE